MYYQRRRGPPSRIQVHRNLRSSGERTTSISPRLVFQDALTISTLSSGSLETSIFSTDNPANEPVRITPPSLGSTFAPPPYKLDPPSYATILRDGETSYQITTMGAFPSDHLFSLSHMLDQHQNNLQIRLSSPFIVPKPPPTYAEAQGIEETDNESEIVVQRISSHYGLGGCQMICPYCAHLIRTNVQSQVTKHTHCTALILCLFGCWPCCLFPYCLPFFQKTEHFCPVCRELVLTFSPFSRDNANDHMLL